MRPSFRFDAVLWTVAVLPALAGACGNAGSNSQTGDAESPDASRPGDPWQRALDALTQETDRVEARVATLCPEMAGDGWLAADALDTEASAASLCSVVVAGAREVAAESFPSGFKPTVAGGPVRCRLKPEVAARCLASLIPEASAFQCEGLQVGECPGVCNGTCIGSCGDRCVGTCGGVCEGTCEGPCNGLCDRPCDAYDAYERCISQCTGTCEGTCGGTCLGRCGGPCTAHCEGTCEGECTGSCSERWDAGCHGTLIHPTEPGANAAACALLAAAEAECSAPIFAFRGPEIEDGENHRIVDNMMWSMWRHWPELTSLRARTGVMLLPHLEALQTAWESTESTGSDAATIEQAAMMEQTRTRIRLAQDQIDELLSLAQIEGRQP